MNPIWVLRSPVRIVSEFFAEISNSKFFPYTPEVRGEYCRRIPNIFTWHMKTEHAKYRCACMANSWTTGEFCFTSMGAIFKISWQIKGTLKKNLNWHTLGTYSLSPPKVSVCILFSWHCPFKISPLFWSYFVLQKEHAYL